MKINNVEARPKCELSKETSIHQRHTNEIMEIEMDNFGSLNCIETSRMATDEEACVI